MYAVVFPENTNSPENFTHNHQHLLFMLRQFSLLVSLMLLLGFQLQAQNPPCDVLVYYNFPNTQTLIAYDSAATPAQSYLWSTGATTQVIPYNAPGTYCVTVTFADGCTASNCLTIEDTCGVGIYSYTGWTGAEVLNAYISTNSAPITSYLWSNGATTSTTVADSSTNVYCVTATNALGCTATACYTVLPNCATNLQVSYDSIGNTATLTLTPLNSNNYNYQWSTGANTQSITVDLNGNYCYTVSDPGGACQSSGCYWVSGLDSVSCPSASIFANGNQLSVYSTDSSTLAYTVLWNTGASSATITANNFGLYCATLYYSNGCTTQACYYYSDSTGTCSVSIQYNTDNSLTAVPTGTAPFTFQWSPGNYLLPTITPPSSGNYTVTMTDANGCTSQASQYFYTADSCTVQIFSYPDSSGLYQLTAYAPGSTWDWAYNWNTGDSTSYISIAAGGSYCVTVTNIYSGCSATQCYWIWPDSSCYVSVQADSLNLTTARLTATNGPGTAVSWLWNTGATTPFIDVTTGGHYGVTVTNDAGCTASQGYWLYPSNSITMRAYAAPAGGGNYSWLNARFFLIKYEETPQGGMLTAVDTIDSYSGWSNTAFAYTSNIQPGEYLLKAALRPFSEGYADFLPTYYGDELIWSDATTITVPFYSPNAWQFNNLQVNLVAGQNPGGPGFIGGLVSQGANFISNEDEAERGAGDPMANVTIVLTRQDGTPVAVVYTHTDGSYSFPNLPWGTYILTIDIPGIAPVSKTITIGPATPSVTDVNFEVEGLTSAVPGIDGLAVQFSAFPNPFGSFLNVKVEEAVQLELRDMSGRTLIQQHVQPGVHRLPADNLPAGMYFLQVRSEKATGALQVSKQ